MADDRKMGDFKSKGPELLVDLADQSSLAMQEILGIDKDKADQVGLEIAQRMAFNWGGQNIYFPRGLSYKMSQRDQRIFDEFNGTNHSELVRKYGVSLQWIYKVVKTVGKEEIARRQGDMFAE